MESFQRDSKQLRPWSQHSCAVFLKTFTQTSTGFLTRNHMSLGYRSCVNTFILVSGCTEKLHKSKPYLPIQTSWCEKWIYFNSYVVALAHLEISAAVFILINTITLYVFRFSVCSNLGEPQWNWQHSLRHVIRMNPFKGVHWVGV